MLEVVDVCSETALGHNRTIALMTRMPVTGCTGPAQDQTEQNASMDEGGAHVYSHRAEELPPLCHVSLFKRESLLSVVMQTLRGCPCFHQQPDTHAHTGSTK